MRNASKKFAYQHVIQRVGSMDLWKSVPSFCSVKIVDSGAFTISQNWGRKLQVQCGPGKLKLLTRKNCRLKQRRPSKHAMSDELNRVIYNVWDCRPFSRQNNRIWWKQGQSVTFFEVLACKARSLSRLAERVCIDPWKSRRRFSLKAWWCAICGGGKIGCSWILPQKLEQCCLS